MIDLKRAVLALALFALVASAGFLGTRAFFSDTETSAGNVFAAGSLNLKIGINAVDSQWPDVDPRENNNQQLFSIDGLMPGQQGNGQFRLLSEGADAWACVSADITGNPENTRLSQEESSGDTSDEADSGELKNYMEIAIWEANGLSNANGKVGPNEEETLQVMSLEEFANGDFYTLQDSSATGGDNPLVSGDEYQHEFAYCFGEFERDGSGDPVINGDNQLVCDGESASNVAQTDGVEMLLSFYAEQKDGNDDFVCSSLNGTSTPVVTVGADLAAYSQPTACNVEVDDDGGVGPDTIAGGLALANPGDVVCVADGTYDENVTITEDITLAGDGADNTSTIDGNVTINADGATVQGFVITGRMNVDGSNVTISDNKFTGGTTLGVVTQAGPMSGLSVTNNVFENFDVTALYIEQQTEGTVVTHNDFVGNGAAIGGVNPGNGGAGSALLAQYNDFQDNDETLGVVGINDLGTVVLTFNNIVDDNNSKADVEVYDVGGSPTGMVDATNNWWGDADPHNDADNDTDPTDGVDVDPFAATAYAN